VPAPDQYQWVRGAHFATPARVLRAMLSPLTAFTLGGNRRLASRVAHEDEGQAIVEAALTLPVILAFVFTMIELCLIFYSYCMISECAREGSRYAIVHGNGCQTGVTKASCTATGASINTYTQTLGWPNLGMGTLHANTTFGNGTQNAGNPVTVTVTYVFPINLPFLPKRNLSLSSSSTMYIIQ
jgi:Flp pilus assembly protein TadG